MQLAQSRNQSIEVRIAEVKAYLTGSSMVCTPGRAALSKGDIRCVGISLDAVSQSANRELPQFKDQRGLRNNLVAALSELVSNERAGVVFVPGSTPRSHYAGLLVTWALWAELALVCAELSKRKPAVTREALRACALRRVGTNGSDDSIALHMKGKERHLFLTSMSPLYAEHQGRPHPRYAPHFCIGMVTREAVAALGTHAEALSKGILNTSFRRSPFPYNNLVAYLLPNRPEHLHSFAKRALHYLPVLQPFCPDLKGEKLSRFINEFAKHMLDTGPRTPFGETTDMIVLERLASNGLIPTEVWSQIKPGLEKEFAMLLKSGGCPIKH